jgi:glucokinase
MKIGIDLGGSHVGVGLIDGNQIIGEIKDVSFTLEDRDHIEDVIIDTIVAFVNEILNENNLSLEDIELIGIASPGTISNGVVVKAGNLGLTNFEIVKRLKEKLNVPIYIRNDGKCAALAEKKYGAMKDYDDCLFVNIGTGIGGAVFIGGKLLEPKRVSGFELGHMVINKDGPLCTCGKHGCFETYGSIMCLRNRIRKTLNYEGDMSGKMIREELIPKHRDELLQDVTEYISYLKIGLCNLIDIFEPEVLCFGGSFSYWSDTDLYKTLVAEINKKDSTFNQEKPKIITAEFKNNAGIIGATIIS